MSKDRRFSDLLGIRRATEAECMELPFNHSVQNHIGQMHASAQFGLAEISSGALMRQTFPDLDGRVLAVVRRAEIKYCKPVESVLQAWPYLEEGVEQKMRVQLTSRGRALLPVHVKLKTVRGDVATHAVYYWFISMLESHEQSN